MPPERGLRVPLLLPELKSWRMCSHSLRGNLERDQYLPKEQKSSDGVKNVKWLGGRQRGSLGSYTSDEAWQERERRAGGGGRSHSSFQPCLPGYSPLPKFGKPQKMLLLCPRGSGPSSPASCLSCLDSLLLSPRPWRTLCSPLEPLAHAPSSFP